MSENKNKIQATGIQLGMAFLVAMICTQDKVNINNIQKWSINLLQFTFYTLLIQGYHFTSTLVFHAFHDKVTLNVSKMIQDNIYSISLGAFTGALLSCTEAKLVGEHFPVMLLASVCYKCLGEFFTASNVSSNRSGHSSQTMTVGVPTSPLITYGVGMACSYYEGYLTHILPSDGGEYGTLEDKIKVYEAKHGLFFPVKMLFIVITKSLFCQPDLKNYDDKKNTPDMPRLEGCQDFEGVEKDVAGVKRRKYKNMAYKIVRPHARSVHVAAECATPLHTLQRVLQKRSVYSDLVDADADSIVNDFCTSLTDIIDKHPESRNKVVLLHFDDTDDTQILAQVMLDKIREIEPDFERLIEEYIANK